MLDPFASYKLKREIQRQGKSHTFARYKIDSNDEPTDEIDLSVDVVGIFHQGSLPFLKLATSDAATIQNKNQPYILTEWAQAEQLKVYDVVVINNKSFEVTGVNNVGEMNVFADICLEVKQNVL